VESLGEIYSRILKNRKWQIEPAPKDSIAVAEICPVCDGIGWVLPAAGRVVPCHCQQEAMAQTLLRAARLPTNNGVHTLGSYNPVEGCQDALESTLAMASGNFEWNILTLTGNPGLGKTHLLEMLGRAVVDKGISVRYLYSPDWIDSLRASNAVDAAPSFDEIWNGVNQTELVLLDDLNEHRVTPFAVEQVGRLIDDRYRNGGLLAVATNLGFIQMADKWDARIADRVFEARSNIVRVSRLTGPSYRTGEDWNARN